MEEKSKQTAILKKQKGLYQGNLNKEDNNGNIEFINISQLSYEDLSKMFFHFSLKKDKNSIDKRGLVSQIGRNSKGIDEKKSIFFSYSIEGLLETWDQWLKWRMNRLYNPYFQEENKSIKERIANNTASEEEKGKYYSKWEQWVNEFTSGEYKEDVKKLKFLFDFQIDEMLSSNYYSLDLIEGEDFSFDDIDEHKSKIISRKDDSHLKSIEYKMLATRYGKYSDLNSPKVDKWNMHTKMKDGDGVKIDPSRIKQLSLSNGKNSVLDIVLYLYDKYSEMIPSEQRAEFDLLDKYIEYVKEQIRNNGLSTFNRDDKIHEVELVSHFHDQKSDNFFQDMKSGVYSIPSYIITPNQIARASLNVPLGLIDGATQRVRNDRINTPKYIEHC